ncbi:MAG TPA: phosphocholine cytidylyltransferase family protein [Bacteroidota bacterium]|nr:phosphocholine cytidylyltransferase family protein [Bacteroidota bacterium]
MKCVILAAGMSKRLRPLTDHLPKCLLSIGGTTILVRTMEALLSHGISDIALVVGFEAGEVKLHLQHQYPKRRFRFVLNPKFASTNNAYSLLLSRNFYLGNTPPKGPGEDLLILDSDILFHPKLLTALLKDTHENRLAVQRRGNHDAEEIKVQVDRNLLLTDIGKDLAPSNTYGESIGIELFSPGVAMQMYETLEQRVRAGNGRTEFYESAFQELIDRGVQIAAVDVTGFPAIEIDSPDDLELAASSVAPGIDASRDVRVS